MFCANISMASISRKVVTSSAAQGHFLLKAPRDARTLTYQQINNQVTIHCTPKVKTCGSISNLPCFHVPTFDVFLSILHFDRVSWHILMGLDGCITFQNMTCDMHQRVLFFCDLCNAIRLSLSRQTAEWLESKSKSVLRWQNSVEYFMVCLFLWIMGKKVNFVDYFMVCLGLFWPVEDQASNGSCNACACPWFAQQPVQKRYLVLLQDVVWFHLSRCPLESRRCRHASDRLEHHGPALVSK